LAGTAETKVGIVQNTTIFTSNGLHIKLDGARDLRPTNRLRCGRNDGAGGEVMEYRICGKINNPG